MKKNLYLFLSLIIFLASCNSDYELKGSFHTADNDGKQVYLLKIIDYEKTPQIIDSSFVNDSRFSFKLKDAKEPALAYIIIKEASPDMPNLIPFIYENGNISMVIDSISHVTGTPLNDNYQTYFDRSLSFGKKIHELDSKIESTEDSALRNEYIGQINALNKEIVDNTYGYIKENIKNKVGEVLLLSMLPSFNDSQISELLAEASPELKKVVEKFQKQKTKTNPMPSFVGEKYIDISGPNPAGKEIFLSDYIKKNKVVLVDFWASWCGPCRTEMPNVVAAYKKYKSKGFEIVGVSLDMNKNLWTEALNDMNMTWPQMSDLRGWDSKISAVYEVTSIPFTLLIDQNGEIIAEKLRGSELEDILADLLE